MLAISYRFDTNRTSRSGMSFSFHDVDEPINSPRRGPVFNGMTPRDITTVSTSTEALDVLSQHIGNTWPEWSLAWVMPDDAEPHYEIAPYMPVGNMKQLKVRGRPAQLICGRTPDGIYDARVTL